MSKNRAGRHAEEIEEKLRLAEAEAAEPDPFRHQFQIHRRIILGDDKRGAAVLVDHEQIFRVGAGQALGQGSRLIDGEHRLVFNLGRGDAELAKADEQSVAIRYVRFWLHLSAPSLIGVMFRRGMVEAPTMDIGRPINYNGRRCLQVRT